MIKRFIEFLFFKIYRIALIQKETVYVSIGFPLFASIFELFHLILIPFKSFGINLNTNPRLFSVIFIVVGFSLNYLMFIKSGKIEKINNYFIQNRKSRLKENIIFTSYCLILILIMIYQTYMFEQSRNK